MSLFVDLYMCGVQLDTRGLRFDFSIIFQLECCVRVFPILLNSVVELQLKSTAIQAVKEVYVSHRGTYPVLPSNVKQEDTLNVFYNSLFHGPCRKSILLRDQIYI